METQTVGNQPSKSKRELFGERLKSKYPDKEYADDEALFGQIGDDYDEYDNKIKGYQDREGQLTDLLVKKPEAAQFLTDMSQGKDPYGSMIEIMGTDNLRAMLDDPSKIEENAELNKKYVERLAKQKELEDAWESNMQATLDMCEALQGERGLSDEELDGAFDWVKQIASDAIVGKISRETMEMALKAIGYDQAVAAAGKEGEVRGRNSKVQAELRKRQGGDGTAVLAGANNAPSRRAKGSIFELASGAS